MWKSTLPSSTLPCTRCGMLQLWLKEPLCQSMPKPFRSKYHNKVHSITQHESSDSSDKYFIDMIQSGTNKSSDWKVTILVNDQKTCFKINTGAQCNVISKQKYHQLSSTPLQKSHARLVAFGGQRLNACGKVLINCQHEGKFYPVVFEVIDQ